MKESNKEYTKVLEESKKAAYYQTLSYLAGWDQDTYMPKDGILPKSEIVSFLAQERHKVLTSTKFTSHLKNLENNSSLKEEEKIVIKRLLEDVQKQEKLGKSFVKKFSKETSLACANWKEAHKTDNFKLFLPSLKKVIALCRKKASLLGYLEHPYDALLDEFEPSMTVRQLDEIFGELKPRLISLVKKITAQEKNGSTYKPKGNFPIYLQKELCHDVIQRVGISKDQYNLSTTHHPFCIPFHPNDVRITTHYHEGDILKAFGAAVHEAGHGLYENNLPAKHYGTPLAEAASLGIHESQSRIFETCIGNSIPFWKYYFPKFQKKFPDALNGTTLEDFLSHVREVKPSLIRIFSDEVTYCLHIIIRYEIEKGLIEETIDPKEIPKLWKSKMQEYLGIVPPSDAMGCLQDVHWSIGCFGYFPTYALGSMYSGSLFTKYIKENVDWAGEIAHGNFSSISNFLKEKVHLHGRKYLPFDLIEKATGKPFTPHDYISYLEHRYLN